MITIRLSGMLMPKAHRHEKLVVSQRPSSGPRAAIPPMVEPQMPEAMPRSLPRKLALRRASEVGSIIAPPMPCSARAAINTSPLPATAASTRRGEDHRSQSEQASPPVLIGQPPADQRRFRRRPGCRSPGPIELRVEVMPDSSMIEGTATLTMVVSTMIRETPRLMIATPNQRLRPAQQRPGRVHDQPSLSEP